MNIEMKSKFWLWAISCILYMQYVFKKKRSLWTIEKWYTWVVRIFNNIHEDLTPRDLQSGAYCVQGNIRTFRPRWQWADLRLDEFQCLKLSIFRHTFVWANSRRNETVCKCKRAKITMCIVIRRKGDWNFWWSYECDQSLNICIDF